MKNLHSETEIASTDLRINCGIVFRFAGMAEAAEMMQRELNAGTHPQTMRLVEKYITLRALVEVLLRAKTTEQTEKATASLANYMDQLTLNGE